MSQRTSWRELVDVWVEVRRIRFEPSRFDESEFAVVDVVRCDTGEELTVTTGARAVLEELGRMRDDEDRLAEPVMLEVNRTRRGRAWFQLIPGGPAGRLTRTTSSSLNGTGAAVLQTSAAYTVARPGLARRDRGGRRE